MINTIGALALAIGFAGVAQAQPNGSGQAIPFYITGSTAFRTTVFNALGDLGLTEDGAKTSGAGYWTFSGNVGNSTVAAVTPISGVSVYASWSGSVEGIQALLYSTNGATYLNADGMSTFTTNGDDLAFSDIGQTSCYQGSLGTAVNYTPAKTGISLTEIRLAADKARNAPTGIAVQPFTFMVSSNALDVTNINQPQFVDLFQGGKIDQSWLSGNPADIGVTVYPVGRYNLSGTRQTSILDFAESPLVNFKQYALSADGSTTPGLNSTDTASVPSGTTATAWVSVANSGYYSGGHVAQAINNSSVAHLPPAVCYIAWSDSSAVTNVTGASYANGAPINYAGQVPWVGGAFPNAGAYNIQGVTNGAYTLWTYERLYANQAVTGGTQIAVSGQVAGAANVETFATDLIEAVQYEIQNSANYTKFGTQGTGEQVAINFSQMGVYRAGDGGDILKGN
jgi:hypothetical protein